MTESSAALGSWRSTGRFCEVRHLISNGYLSQASPVDRSLFIGLRARRRGACGMLHFVLTCLSLAPPRPGDYLAACLR